MCSTFCNNDSFGKAIDTLSVTQIKQPFDFVSQLYSVDSHLQELPDIDKYLDPRFAANWELLDATHPAQEGKQPGKEEVRAAKAALLRAMGRIDRYEHRTDESLLLQYAEQQQLLPQRRERQTRQRGPDSDGFARFNPDGSLRIERHLEDSEGISDDSMGYCEEQGDQMTIRQFVGGQFTGTQVRDRTSYGQYWQCEAGGGEDDQLPHDFDELPRFYVHTHVRQRLCSLASVLSQNEGAHRVIEQSYAFEHACLERGQIRPSRPRYGSVDLVFRVRLLCMYDAFFSEHEQTENDADFLVTRGQQGGWAFALSTAVQTGKLTSVCPICTKFQIISFQQYQDYLRCRNLIVPERPSTSWTLIVENQVVCFVTDLETLGALNSALCAAYGEVVGRFDASLGSTLPLQALYHNRQLSCAHFQNLYSMVNETFRFEVPESLNCFCETIATADELFVQRKISQLFLIAGVKNGRKSGGLFVKSVVDTLKLELKGADLLVPYFFKYPMLSKYSQLASLDGGPEFKHQVASLQRCFSEQQNAIVPQEVAEMLGKSEQLAAIPPRMPEFESLSICYIGNQVTDSFAIQRFSKLQIDVFSNEFYLFVRLLPQMTQDTSDAQKDYRRIVDIFRYQFEGRSMQMAFSFSEKTQTAILWVAEQEVELKYSQFEALYGQFTYQIKPMTRRHFDANVLLATHIRFSAGKLIALVQKSSQLPYLLEYSDKIPLQDAESELGVSLQKAEAYIDVLQVEEQRFSVALTDELAALADYEYADLDHVNTDLGLIFNQKLGSYLAEHFAEYLQVLSFNDLPPANSGDEEKSFELEVDESDSSFVIDEFSEVPDVQYAITQHFDCVLEDVQAQSFFKLFLIEAAKFSPVRYVWKMKCSGEYAHKVRVSRATEPEIDELQCLGLFFNGYEAQFSTALAVSSRNIQYLRCRAGCPVETVKAPLRRGFSFPPSWDQIDRK